MIIRILEEDPDEALSHRLESFETQFTYPLGADDRFHVDHAGDAWRFFASMGEAAYVVCQAEDGGVRGVIGGALRRLVGPGGSECPALYLGDLKIDSAWRGSLVLSRLLRALHVRFNGRCETAFAVVMDGTEPTPVAYTGRLGIPPFTAVDKQVILWMSTHGETISDQAECVGDESGRACFADLAIDRFNLPYADARKRSLLAPQWFISGSSQACGRLEDTLRAKRLRSIAGADMRSAHLSCFAFSRPEDGLRVLRAALSAAASAGYPMLFVALPMQAAEVLRPALGERIRLLAPATVYGTRLPRSGSWIINTAEI